MTETGVNEEKNKAFTGWDIRKNIAELHGLTAARKYDDYLKEHRRKLKALEKTARGEVSPSDEWYRE